MCHHKNTGMKKAAWTPALRELTHLTAIHLTTAILYIALFTGTIIVNENSEPHIELTF